MSNEPIDLRALELTSFEGRLMSQVAWARTQVGSGNFLPSPRMAKTALRLIARGFLDDAKVAFSPPQSDWVTVRLTDMNYATIRDAAEAAAAFRPEYPRIITS